MEKDILSKRDLINIIRSKDELIRQQNELMNRILTYASNKLYWLDESLNKQEDFTPMLTAEEWRELIIERCTKHERV